MDISSLLGLISHSQNVKPSKSCKKKKGYMRAISSSLVTNHMFFAGVEKEMSCHVIQNEQTLHLLIIVAIIYAIYQAKIIKQNDTLKALQRGSCEQCVFSRHAENTGGWLTQTIHNSHWVRSMSYRVHTTN